MQADFQKAWKRKAHLIFLVHDRYHYISSDDVADVLSQISALDKRQPIDIILHTRGGGAGESDQIAAALVERPNTCAYVPIFANSGGTEIALATKTIVMGRAAELGPIDLKLGDWSARDLVRTAEELGESASEELRLLAKNATKALKDETRRVCRLINRAHKGLLGWRRCALAKALTSGDMPHEQGIQFRLAKKLHMNVRQGVPKSLYAILNLRREQLVRLREIQRTQTARHSSLA